MKPRDFRVWWAGSEIGWVVDTEFGLSRQMLEKIAQSTMATQKQRLTGLVPGPKRDECIETITALQNGRITQNLIGRGEKVLFDVYKSNKVIVGVN